MDDRYLLSGDTLFIGLIGRLDLGGRASLGALRSHNEGLCMFGRFASGLPNGDGRPNGRRRKQKATLTHSLTREQACRLRRR